jgi:UDP-N-acetylglucosamine transferase subunit ALG13
MIFVTVGTNETPFDRLVAVAQALGADHSVIVQYGSSSHTSGPGDWHDFLPFEEMESAMRTADAVVTHAGVGSILLALRSGRRPIVMPRRHVLAEAVDDHQVVLARRLERAGLVSVAEDAGEVFDRLQDVLEGTTMPSASLSPDPAAGLTAELATYLSEHARTRTGARRLARRARIRS